MTETLHSVHFQAETENHPPADGWRVVVPSGRARTSCRCGLDTGLADAAEARRVLVEHVGVMGG